METKILQKPYLLFEAVNLLHAYVNDIPPEKLTTQEPLSLKPEQIRALQHTCCRGLNRTESELVYYFKNRPDRPVDGGSSPYCLAFAMVYSFMLWEYPDWRDHLAALNASWEALQIRGYHIESVGKLGLLLTEDTEQPHIPLASQIYRLDIPAEDRLELIEVFTNYSAHLTKLRQLMEPVMLKLESALLDFQKVLASLAEAWSAFFTQCPAEEFLAQRGRITLNPERGRIVVGFSLVDSWCMGGDLREETFFLYAGAGQPQSLQVGSRGAGMLNEGELDAMKLLGDQNRLNLLRILSKERSYCLELSQKLNLNAGTVSRLLTGLYNVGLLNAEQEGGRTYYKTNTELVGSLFQNVLRFIRQED